MAAPELYKAAGATIAAKQAEVRDVAAKLAAAYAIASCVGKEEISEDYIIPSVFNRKVAPIVAKEVSRAAHRTKVARRTSKTYMEIHLD